MENTKKSCPRCYEDITEKEVKEYKGYCKRCYEEITCNIVAKIIKIIAIIICILGIFSGLSMMSEYLITEELGFSLIVGSIIIAVFMYGYGEIIQLLEDIKNK